jgi:hypothetical protein
MFSLILVLSSFHPTQAPVQKHEAVQKASPVQKDTHAARRPVRRMLRGTFRGVCRAGSCG